MRTMHSRKSSSSTPTSEDFGARYHFASGTAPSIKSVEELIKLELRLQQEIGARLGATGAGLDKNLKETKRIVEVDMPTSETF